jgi:hypothetical protein
VYDEIWSRNFAAGITKGELIISQIIVTTCALVLLNCITFISGLIILDIHVPAGNEVSLAILIILTAFSAQYTVLLMMSILKTYTGVFQSGAAFCYVVGYSSGKIAHILIFVLALRLCKTKNFSIKI